MEPLTPEDAEAQLMTQVQKVGVERVPLAQASGRVAASGVRSRIALPAFDNSAVDGYAVSGGPAASHRLVGWIYAGDATPGPLGPGQTVFVATGASVPAGAGVARQEDVSVRGDKVVFGRHPEVGENVRRAGQEVRAGAPILGTGERVGPGQMALLQTTGVGSLTVRQRIRATVLSIGSELREDRPSGAGLIRNTNGPWLAHHLSALGCLVSQRTLSDDEGQFQAELRSGLATSHLLLTTGGAARGPRDFVRSSAKALGLEQVLDGVLMRPGQPLQAFAAQGALWIALPGNPLATALGFDRLVRPLLAAMEGRTSESGAERAALAAPLPPNRGTVVRFFPGSVWIGCGRLEARPAESYDSGAVSALRGLTAWIRADAGQASLPKGADVRIWLPRRLFT